MLCVHVYFYRLYCVASFDKLVKDLFPPQLGVYDIVTMMTAKGAGRQVVGQSGRGVTYAAQFYDVCDIVTHCLVSVTLFAACFL